MRFLPLLLVLGCSTQDAHEPAAGEPSAAAEAPSTTPESDKVLAATHFGAPFTVTEAMPAAALFADPDAHLDKVVRVQGEVADVCQKAGCWMVLRDGEHTMRVTMKEHGFSVAKDGTGAMCQIEGTLVSKVVDPDTVAHYESEAARPEVIPEKQAKGGVHFEIIATGVSLQPRS